MDKRSSGRGPQPREIEFLVRLQRFPLRECADRLQGGPVLSQIRSTAPAAAGVAPHGAVGAMRQRALEMIQQAIGELAAGHGSIRRPSLDAARSGRSHRGAARLREKVRAPRSHAAAPGPVIQRLETFTGAELRPIAVRSR